MKTKEILPEVGRARRFEPDADQRELEPDGSQLGRTEVDYEISDAPYIVGWSGQSHEWYGDLENPGGPDGRYKPKGDGGRIVAYNITDYEAAKKIADSLDQAYKDGNFDRIQPHSNVYNKMGSGYMVDYQGAWVKSMNKMSDYDREDLEYAKKKHPSSRPKDYSV